MKTQKLRAIDAHFHVWDLKENYYPWLSDEPMKKMVIGDYSSIRRDYLISEYLEDASCIELLAAVHVQAEHDDNDHVRETRWLQGVADSRQGRGFPQAIVGNADLQSVDAEAVLEAHCECSNIRGIRQAVHRWLADTPPYDPLLDPAWSSNFALLKKFNLSFDLQMLPQQIDGCVSLVEQYPDIQFILTHMGFPLRPEPEHMAHWRSNISRLAKFQNLSVKLSGFGVAKRDWTPTSALPSVSHIIENFGSNRCLIASNYPVEGLTRPYAQIWTDYAALFADYSDAEREDIFWRTAARVYRIDVPDSEKSPAQSSHR